MVSTSGILNLYIRWRIKKMINRAQEINGSHNLTAEDPCARLRSQFSAFPDQQLRIMLQCRHPSGAYQQFDREDIEQSIAGRFQQQVACFPNRLAVQTGSDSLTYAGLNDAANRVARQLLSAVPDVTRVGVLLDHGLSAVVGYLGVMKAGKVCVFLDRAGPKERAKAIVENAGLGCVISDECGLESLRELGFSSGPIISIANCDRQSTANPDLEIRPTAPAEITYSSGSTGLPKGIVHSHRNRLHKAWILTNAFQISPHDRIAFLHSLTSGPATTDIHLALLNGAALCSFDITQRDMSTLAAWLVDNGITILHWVPSLFRHFGAALQAEDKFSTVRLVMLGSEPATTRDLELVKQHFSDSCGFVNRLGAIETANTRLFFANIQTELPTGALPAGYMLPDQRMFLVNERGQPVPTGAIGEIVICSEWLAIEYYGQPDLTAAAFFASPKDGARCFRTGDLGRLAQDGCLEYLGRADGRTKVRGRWVDTTKIETLLAEQAHVAECAVVARDEDGSGSQLTAFLVPTAESLRSVSELRSLLLQSLPSDTLPSRFLTLARLPRLGTGKLDRCLLSLGTLAALGTACGAVEELREADKFVAPNSDLEKSLTKIWEELFDITPLGIHDSFFDLGGNSLLAMSLMARIEAASGKKLPLATLFEHPTIADMARILQQASRPTRQSALVKIQSEGSRLPLFFSPSIGGEAFFCKTMARHLGTDQPIWSFQVLEQDGVRKPFLDIETMAASFVNDLTKAQIPGPFCLAGYSFGAAVALEMAQQLWARGDRVALLAILDWGFPTPGPRTIGRLLRSTWASFRNLPYWLSDDFLHTPAKGMLTRMFGEFREIARRVRHPRGPAQGISSGEDPWERTLAPEYQVLIETHRNALKQYRPRPYPGRITLFRARARGLLSSGRERDLGWGRFARGGVDVRMIPGTHLTMTAEPFVQILAHEMHRALETANKEISWTT